MLKIVFQLTVLMLVTAAGVLGQTPTDELLGAPRVRAYLEIVPNFGATPPAFNFSIDKPNDPRTNKPLSGSMAITVRAKDRSINFVTPFYNPLQFSLKVSDTLLVDPAFQSVTDFVNALSGLLKEVNAPIAGQANPDGLAVSMFERNFLSGASAERNNFDLGALPANVRAVVNPASEVVSKLESGQLAEWGYLSLGPSVTCVNWNSSAIAQLSDLDGNFTGQGFNNLLINALKDLQNASNTNEFETKAKDFGAIIKNLTEENNENRQKLKAFGVSINKDDFLIASGVNSNVCEGFEHYSRAVFQRFLELCKDTQAKREKLIALAEKLNSSFQKIIYSAGGSLGSRPNAFILGQYPVSLEQMRDVSLVMRKREVNFSSDPPEVKDLDDKINTKIRIRAYRRLIPEFSIGTYYSTLSYDLYNAKTVSRVSSNSLVDTITKVDSTIGKDKNPMVLAGMLNLTLNNYSGEAHPVFQFGVGTGKGRPSILLGGGIRFRRANPLVISLGIIWAWKKELNKLKPGQNISGQSEIDNDLKYQGLVEPFRNAPQFYAGLQYAFKSK